MHMAVYPVAQMLLEIAEFTMVLGRKGIGIEDSRYPFSHMLS